MSALIDSVRLKSDDKPKLYRESADGDGASTIWHTQYNPILLSPAIDVYVSGILKTPTTDYTVNTTDGMVTFLIAPLSSDKLTFQYYATVYTDAEIQTLLDEAYSNTDYATAKLLLAWAANAAKLAQRETIAGGQGVRSVTRDTSVVAQELRATAAALMDMYNSSSVGANRPVEGLTEVPWTEQVLSRQMDQEYFRNN